jgi:hypothetical protein
MTSTSNNIQLTEELKSRIKKALKQVCVEAHSTPNKQLLKDMPGRITLACPYCGDSHTDDTKNVAICIGTLFSIIVTIVQSILIYMDY